MIDSIALTWGHSIGSAARRVDIPRDGVPGVDGGFVGRARGKNAEPVAAPVMLDIDELGHRLGSDDGQVRSIQYAHGRPSFGHWKVGAVELMYREGRVELRTSLPKLLTGRNDVVLDERGVHDGLRELVRIGEELTQHPLALREAVPTRLDFAWQWEVQSVAWTLEHVKSQFSPARLARSEIVSTNGGRSLVFGYGKRRVIRFYDKVGELAAHKEHSNHELDTLLRYEIQDRHRPRLRLIHERGYQSADVERELRRTIDVLGAIAMHDVEQILASNGKQWAHGVAYTLAALHLADHDELWPVMRRTVSEGAYYRWRRRARRVALEANGQGLAIPENAFAADSSLWRDQAAA